MSPAVPTVPPLISAPLLVITLWAVCLALGYRALRLSKISLAPFLTWERGAICTAVGAGLLQYEPYALGALGALSPRHALLGFGLIFVLLIPDLLHLGRAMGRTLSGLHIRQMPRPLQIWLLPLGLLLGILLIRALTLDAFGSDDDGYHLAAPKRWLTDGSLSYLPSYTNTNASLGFEMLYALGLSTGNWGVKIIHFSAGIFSLLTLGLCARRMGSGVAGTIAISLVMIATPFCNLPMLFGLALVDFGAVWMTLTSVLVWLTWREQPGSAGRLLVLLALLTGFAASFKSTALTVAVAWIPVLVWEARRLGLGWGRIAAMTIGLGVVAFLPVAPWMYRSWHLTGNPVYPMLSGLIPTRDWNPDMAAVFNRYIHYYSWATGTHMSELARREILAVTAATVVASGVLLMVLAKDMAIRCLFMFAVVIVLMTMTQLGLYFRYWLPGEMCAALGLAMLLFRRLPSAVTRWLPALLALAGLLVDLRGPGTLANGRQAMASNLRVAAGLTSPDQAYASDPGWQLWHFINENTARDARILVGSFYTTFGASNYDCFWLEVRCYTTDSYIQTFIRLNDWRSFARSLNEAGIRYLLIADQQFAPGRIGFTFTAEQNEYPFCRMLADRFGRKLAQFGNLQFYRLGPIPEILPTAGAGLPP